jgi:hypothetical protein
MFPLIKFYGMSLISAGSISLDSTFKAKIVSDKKPPLSKSFVVISDPKILNNFMKQEYPKKFTLFCCRWYLQPQPPLIASNAAQREMRER